MNDIEILESLKSKDKERVKVILDVIEEESSDQIKSKLLFLCYTNLCQTGS
jgi:hypothetical protein